MAILQEIPLQAIPNQQIDIVLNGQNVTLHVYLQDVNLFCEVYLGTQLIVAGRRCVHGSYLNQYPTSLIGNLFWWDDNGLDPVYTNIGTISNLYYSDYDYLNFAYQQWLKAGGPL